MEPRDTLVNSPVCVIHDSDDEGSQAERSNKRPRPLNASDPINKRQRREGTEPPRDMIDLTGDEEERRAFAYTDHPTSLSGPPPPTSFPRNLGFGGLPRVPIIHLFQHLAAAPWNHHLNDHSGRFRDNDPVPFDDLTGGYWARRRKKQAKESRRKSKKLNILNLIDDSEESEMDSHSLSHSHNYRSNLDKFSHNHSTTATTTTTTTTTTDNGNGRLESDSTLQDGHTKKKTETDPNIQISELGNLLRKVKCTICLSPLEDLTASVCGHIFCEGCIMQAIKSQGKCPICRRPLTERSIHPLFL